MRISRSSLVRTVLLVFIRVLSSNGWRNLTNFRGLDWVKLIICHRWILVKITFRAAGAELKNT